MSKNNVQIQITSADVKWNYAASFLKISGNALLLPFILKKMPSETVGIWSIFITITTLSSLLDFGFGSSFARNVTYIFSGVKMLQTNGVENVEKDKSIVDFGLLRGAISAMRWFYMRMAGALFLLLIGLGTYYIHSILRNYNGNRQEVYIAWFILCVINSYSQFTLFYDSLLLGKGLIKRSKQIIIIGQIVYLIIAIFLVFAGKNLIAIVSAQAVSVILIRWLSYKTFFTSEIKQKLNESVARNKSEIIRAIAPNAIKVGLTTLGWFMVQKSAIVIGSLFLPLTSIASYGITMQLVSMISVLAVIYPTTYQPKISQLFVIHNDNTIKDLYLTGQAFLFLTYIACGFCFLAFGDMAIRKLGSQTQLLPGSIMLVFLIVSLLESNHSLAGTILLSKNEAPFFKASLIAGVTTIILLLIIFKFTKLNLWTLVISQGIANLYNNWKWPHEVYKLLKIPTKGFFMGYTNIYRLLIHEN